MTALAPTLQAFFTDRLIRQRQASPHTIAAYRDTLRLLLAFAAARTGSAPSRLDLARPRRPAGRRVPRPPRARPGQRRPHPQRPARRDPLAVPATRRCATPSMPPSSSASWPSRPSASDRKLVTFLTEPEAAALLAAPTRHRPGRRDHALLLLAVQTGLRVSELTAPRPRRRPSRHRRPPPLHRARAAKSGSPRSPARPSRSCGVWLTERAGDPTDPLFPTAPGRRSAATPSSAGSRRHDRS